MELNKAIKQRHSVRKFKSAKPDWREIIECIDASRYAPMAGNNFTLKFILITDKDKIQKIADASQQNFVGQVHCIVIACSSPSRTINAYEERGKKFVKQQAGAAIENFLLAIEEKNLATCWVGYFDERLIKEELKIPEDIEIEAVFPLGYELEKPRTRKVKIDLNNILYFDVYGNKRMKKIKKMDV